MYNKINVLHQNINGLISKSDLLSLHLNELACNNKLVDVLCITEHNMKEGDDIHLYIPNYTLATLYVRNNRRGGSCILVNIKHKYKILNLKEYCCPSVLEGCAIELIDHRITILCIYRSPKFKMDAINSFFNQFEGILQKLCNNNKNKVLICGDFNIDI